MPPPNQRRKLWPAMGVRAVNALRRHLQSRITGHVADWSAGERAQLRDVLHRLNGVLERVATDDASDAQQGSQVPRRR
jgi:hypothetical protein